MSQTTSELFNQLKPYIIRLVNGGGSVVVDGIPQPASLTPLEPTTSGDVGTALEYARADHQHPLGSAGAVPDPTTAAYAVAVGTQRIVYQWTVNSAVDVAGRLIFLDFITGSGSLAGTGSIEGRTL
jgi:hypothetical protein